MEVEKECTTEAVAVDVAEAVNTLLNMIGAMRRIGVERWINENRHQQSRTDGIGSRAAT